MLESLHDTPMHSNPPQIWCLHKSLSRLLPAFFIAIVTRFLSYDQSRDFLFPPRKGVGALSTIGTMARDIGHQIHKKNP
jgi:hypothetical protein